MTDVIVLGIDPSLTGTGIAYNDATHTITSKPTGTTLEDRRARLADIMEDLNDAVLGLGPWDFAPPADLVVIEAPSLAQHSQRGTLDRNGLWWLIVYRLHAIGIRTIEASPSTVKKFATGKGNATKPDMRMALFQRAGIDCRDDNQVDAWWLAEIGAHLLDIPTLELPKAHLDALDKIDRSPLTVSA
jgi:Holliday junction resolvasome RuvABC endonuclease subunit